MANSLDRLDSVATTEAFSERSSSRGSPAPSVDSSVEDVKKEFLEWIETVEKAPLRGRVQEPSFLSKHGRTIAKVIIAIVAVVLGAMAVTGMLTLPGIIGLAMLSAGGAGLFLTGVDRAVSEEAPPVRERPPLETLTRKQSK
jgi:hypothetical protein